MSRVPLLLAVALLGTSSLAGGELVGPVPNLLRQTRNLEAFYQKHLAVNGFSILSSEKVSDHALQEAAWILRQMLAGRDDILQTLDQQGVHLTVMAWNEFTTDVPEHRQLEPRLYWDRRARGLGGSPVSCGEENLLCYPGDPYAKENLLIHEFSHAIHGIALGVLDPTFDKRLEAAYQAAKEKGLWHGTYAGANREEYWAEAAQDWFDDNRENDALHNHVNTRQELKEYDPTLAQLCCEVFGDKTWRYHKPTERGAEDCTHLTGLQRSGLPRFRWREEPIPDRPRVLIQTELGDIELELDARQAPKTVENFLAYVHEGFYSDGQFCRMVTLPHQPDDPVKIEISISTGPQFALDFAGQRIPEQQGMAVVGQVTKGMDVVRQIHQAPAEGQPLMKPVRIQRAIRLN